MNLKVKMLEEKGEIITSEAGNSMLPIIKSKQKHKLVACNWFDCQVDDIVFCKVNGRYITHKVWAINESRGLLIGNNKGFKNGWTKSVFGKVTEIYP
jgi:hypothetical protein